MRDLAPGGKNLLKINDAVSGTKIELEYRMPTTQEMVQYQARQVHRANGKVILRPFETRLDYGIKILTGIRDGDFGYEGKPISCNPTSADYKENWKELLKESAADIVTTLAITVFEGARVDTGEIRIEGEEEGVVVQGEDVPL